MVRVSFWTITFFFFHKRKFSRLQWMLALFSGMFSSWLMKARVLVLHVARSGHFLVSLHIWRARWNFFFFLKGNWPCEIRVQFFQLPLTFIAFLKLILNVFVHTQTQTPPTRTVCAEHIFFLLLPMPPLNHHCLTRQFHFVSVTHTYTILCNYIKHRN